MDELVLLAYCPSHITCQLYIIILFKYIQFKTSQTPTQNPSHSVPSINLQYYIFFYILYDFRPGLWKRKWKPEQKRRKRLVLLQEEAMIGFHFRSSVIYLVANCINVKHLKLSCEAEQKCVFFYIFS